MSLPVALQLYSVHAACAEDLPGVLEQVASWGYDGVEFAGLHGHSADDVRAMLDAHGLRCAGAHVPIDALTDAKIEATLDDYAALKCPYLVVPSLPIDRRNTIEAAEDTAGWLTRMANAVEPRGFLAGFHCHFDDLRPLDDGEGVETSAWYTIARNTPASFIMQYDTANGLDAGVDPLKPLADFPGRAVTLHLKEYVKGNGDGTGHGQAALGAGDVPWKEVLDLAQGSAGTRWLIVEQEGHPTLDPMAAAKACLDGLRPML